MLRGIYNKKVHNIAKSVLANVKANFELQGYHNLDCIEWDVKENKYLIFKCYLFNDCPHMTKFKYEIKYIMKEREEIIIMDLSYKLLLWLNDLTFDKRCEEWYTDLDI